jgi:precorrin-8X/cobalt-precorrin-8 methylmutase
MGKVAVVILAPGSRHHGDVVSAMKTNRSRISHLVPPHIHVFFAFLQFNRPKPEEVLRECLKKRVRAVFILPFFLLPGKHVTEDIQAMIADLRKDFPDLEIRLGRSIGSQVWFFDPVLRWILEELHDFYWTGKGVKETCCTSSEIRYRSLAFSKSLLRSSEKIEEPARDLLTRLIHSTGDPSITTCVKWSEGGLQEGVKALLDGCDIITDVRMVKAGLREDLVRRLGCNVFCASEVSGDAEPTEGTRISRGMRSLAGRFPGSLVAIGNAPSALLTLLKHTKKEDLEPSLVVGMPVGFLHAAEAKALLSRSGLHYVTVMGSRGGSPMAAATVNALLETALESGKKKNEKAGRP